MPWLEGVQETLVEVVRVAAQPAEWLAAGAFLGAISTTHKAIIALVATGATCMVVGAGLASWWVMVHSLDPRVMVLEEWRAVHVTEMGHAVGLERLGRLEQLWDLDVSAMRQQVHQMWCIQFPGECQLRPRS